MIEWMTACMVSECMDECMNDGMNECLNDAGGVGLGVTTLLLGLPQACCSQRALALTQPRRCTPRVLSRTASGTSMYGPQASTMRPSFDASCHSCTEHLLQGWDTHAVLVTSACISAVCTRHSFVLGAASEN